MNQIKAKASVGFTGIFRVQKIRKGQVTFDSGEYDNLITNSGLDALGDKLGYLQRCVVGSGTNPPAFSDTSLQSLVAGVNNPVGITGIISSVVYLTNAIGDLYYTKNVREYNFPVGAIVGNISEIGIANPDGSILFSRELIRDANGNPTTITLLADESLRVFHELRVYPPNEDVVTVADGVTFTARAYRTSNTLINNTNWILSASTFTNNSSRTQNFSASQEPTTRMADGPLTNYTGALSNLVSQTNTLTNETSYVSGSYKRNFLIELDVNQLNITKDVLVVYRGPTAWQILMEPPYSKTDLFKAEIRFEISWGRHNGPT